MLHDTQVLSKSEKLVKHVRQMSFSEQEEQLATAQESGMQLSLTSL
jgi:hypothetical protein